MQVKTGLHEAQRLPFDAEIPKTRCYQLLRDAAEAAAATDRRELADWLRLVLEEILFEDDDGADDGSGTRRERR